MNQHFPMEETKLASRICHNGSNHTTVAASIFKLLVYYTALTELGQSEERLQSAVRNE